jgi:hypothetical protein
VGELDLALVDLSFPQEDGTGLEALVRIHQHSRATKLAIITQGDEWVAEILRDAWELAEVALDTPRERLGDRAMLERYLRGRRTDRIAGIAFTHGLVNVFGNDLPLVRWPRGLALTMLDAVPAAKRAFTRAMLFGLR